MRVLSPRLESQKRLPGDRAGTPCRPPRTPSVAVRAACAVILAAHSATVNPAGSRSVPVHRGTGRHTRYPADHDHRWQIRCRRRYLLIGQPGEEGFQRRVEQAAALGCIDTRLRFAQRLQHEHAFHKKAKGTAVIAIKPRCAPDRVRPKFAGQVSQQIVGLKHSLVDARRLPSGAGP